jgi:hypothetical protein
MFNLGKMLGLGTVAKAAGAVSPLKPMGGAFGALLGQGQQAQPQGMGGGLAQLLERFKANAAPMPAAPMPAAPMPAAPMPAAPMPAVPGVMGQIAAPIMKRAQAPGLDMHGSRMPPMAQMVQMLQNRRR